MARPNIEEEMHLGTPVINWEVDEYHKHERSRTWYIVASVMSVVFIIYAIATANFLFAVIILMIGVITLLSTYKEPERVPVIVTDTGIIVDDTFYDFESIRDFSIAFEPPHVNLLYVDFHSAWHPMLSIPLEHIDPNRVRDSLLNYCPENLHRTEESMTDMFRRLYKF